MVVKYRFRLYLFTLVLLMGFGAVSQRLWNLSVERHEEFKHKVPGTKTLRARVPGFRGEIKDRNGIPLVRNKSSFEVQINLYALVAAYKEMLAEQNKLLPKDQRRSLPLYKYRYPERGIIREKDELDIKAVVDEVVIASLNNLGIAREYNANSLRVHYRTNRGVVPWVYCSDLSFEEFSQFAEHRLGLPGVSVTERAVRQYIYDSLACHVLGYVSQPDEQKVPDEERSEWDFYVPDDFGVAGIEKTFDTELRGRPGVRTMLQNEKGRIVKALEYTEPRKGSDLYLAIDARIQYIAERALRESTPAIGRGSIVVLDPNNGDVIAMASVPSYNPNKFIPSISREDFRDYTSNTANPLFNRAVNTYAPGSTYKVMIAFAGILAGNQNDRLNCGGSVTYGSKAMKCWIASKGGAHGTLGLTDAIMRSCNCYFYLYGNNAGIENIEKAGKMFGLGERTGIELLEEDPGILPSPGWLRANRPRERWSNGYTANTSIGQGQVLASPLQMAGVSAATANGGIAYRPHLLRKIMDGTELVREQKPEIRGNFIDHGMTPAKIELIRKGMWKVVNETGGTARSARIENVEVAGKTGTAQNWAPNGKKDNHTLFITFAPYNNPKYAACIFVQGGHSGGGTAAPIAKRVLEQALALDTGYTIQLAAVPEVVGSFDQIMAVSYDGLPAITLPGTEDEDTGTINEDEPPRPTRARDTQVSKPKVKIREEADAEGSAAVKNRQPPPRRANFFKRMLGR
ncbi:penicillin-binding protein 2 [Phragmitibacter flavus]|uniref:Penicillin-binding protein 2 n=1 Tax=Phragmitibacter flavus TaxID=2576071 RepID=A0A5R8KHZ3_9BACT|nr:penicillin-binding protein 2 [Phragmitibacter flavus]TLD71902.1 penicillin-binding protein 2 [Phragmitibacter flavus]